MAFLPCCLLPSLLTENSQALKVLKSMRFKVAVDAIDVSYYISITLYDHYAIPMYLCFCIYIYTYT